MTTFILTPAHIKLARTIYFYDVDMSDRSDYSPIIQVNSKRPYGNSSWQMDIWEAMHGKSFEETHPYADFWDHIEEHGEEETINLFHSSMPIVMTIMLSEKFEGPGVYQKMIPWQAHSWEKIQ